MTYKRNKNMSFDFNTKLIENNSVAVIVCGMIREWKFCVESFYENFIKPNESNFDIDIFLVTYDSTDRYFTNRKLKEKILDDEFNNLKKQFNTEILHIVNFESNKQQILEQVASTDTPMIFSENFTNYNILERIYMQSYLLKQSLSFVNNKNKKYDSIMRTRFDVLYDQEFVIPLSLMQNSIYQLPHNSSGNHQNFADHCFLGLSDAMKKMLSSYDLLIKNPSCTTSGSYNNNRIEPTPYIENLFATNMKKNNIMPISNENWKLSIIRDKNSTQGSENEFWCYNSYTLYPI